MRFVGDEKEERTKKKTTKFGEPWNKTGSGVRVA
jgi:hypothetical protein